MEYEILVKNDTKFLNMDSIKLKRKSRNEPHKFYGDLIFFRDLERESNLRLVAEGYKKQGGEYRKQPYHLKIEVCEFISTDKLVYQTIANISGMAKSVCYMISIILMTLAVDFLKFIKNSHVAKCPVSAGTYNLGKGGWFPEMTRFPLFLASGDYMLEGRIFDGDEMLQGWQIYGNVINIKGGLIGLK